MISKFQAGNRAMGRKGATYQCHVCKRQTRETGYEESSLQLCAYCLLEAYLENELSDGVIEQPEFEQKLDELQKEYKRGKYGKTEADQKVRKVQSSRFIVEDKVANDILNSWIDLEEKKPVNLVKAAGIDLGTDRPSATRDRAHAAATQKATQSKAKTQDMVSVKLGYGIVEVLQLDDASNVKDYGLEIDFSKKSFITVTGTRSALAYFSDCCQNRISSQYDQPLWYMSAAKAAMVKINAALEAK
jgi:hypothetical protein